VEYQAVIQINIENSLNVYKNIYNNRYIDHKLYKVFCTIRVHWRQL